MTGSALQALGVEFTCDSSCKGRGVRGEGGARARPGGGLADDGKRSDSLRPRWTFRIHAEGSFPFNIYIFLYRGGVRGGENHSGSDSIPGLADLF